MTAYRPPLPFQARQQEEQLLPPWALVRSANHTNPSLCGTLTWPHLLTTVKARATRPFLPATSHLLAPALLSAASSIIRIIKLFISSWYRWHHQSQHPKQFWVSIDFTLREAPRKPGSQTTRESSGSLSLPWPSGAMRTYGMAGGPGSLSPRMEDGRLGESPLPEIHFCRVKALRLLGSCFHCFTQPPLTSLYINVTCCLPSALPPFPRPRLTPFVLIRRRRTPSWFVCPGLVILVLAPKACRNASRHTGFSQERELSEFESKASVGREWEDEN